MTCGFVVVTWNGEACIRACLESIVTQSVPPAHLVIIDNGSRDGTWPIVERFAADASTHRLNVHAVREADNTGFPIAANRGIAWLMGLERPPDFVALLNQDAAIDRDWSSQMADTLAGDPAIGAVGSRLLMPDRLTVQHAGGYLERPRLEGRHFGHHEPASASTFGVRRDVEFVTAAAMALRTAAVAAVGPFDALFSPGYYEDVDWCARARLMGWRVVYEPAAVGVHAESTSFRTRADRLSLVHRNRLLFALPTLLEPPDWTAFREAERRWLAESASPDERRAVAHACLACLLRLPPAREMADHDAGVNLDRLIDDLALLRRQALAHDRGATRQ